MIDKDNPPEDNLFDVKMTSPSDPEPLRFVSPPATAQPINSTTHSDNDDMLMNIAFQEDLFLVEWTPDNYVPPNNKENSTKVRKPSISISYAKIQKVDDLINNDDSTTTPASTPSTKSRRNVLEQRKKRRRRKERDEKAKELEKKVHALQQQLRETEEKQKQKDEYTTELHKSLERCRLLETKKLKQLDDLI